MVSPANSVKTSTEGTKYEKERVFTISDDCGSALSSPLPTNDNGESEISFQAEMPEEETQYEGNVVAFSPSMLPEDPFMTPRASAGISHESTFWQRRMAASMLQKVRKRRERIGMPHTTVSQPAEQGRIVTGQRATQKDDRS